MRNILIDQNTRTLPMGEFVPRNKRNIQVPFPDSFLFPHSLQDVMLKLLDTAEFDETSIRRIETITKREREVLDWISQGWTSEEIGEKLFISVHTVNTHRKNIMRKLNAKNVNQAFRIMLTYEVWSRMSTPVRMAM